MPFELAITLMISNILCICCHYYIFNMNLPSEEEWRRESVSNDLQVDVWNDGHFRGILCMEASNCLLGLSISRGIVGCHARLWEIKWKDMCILSSTYFFQFNNVLTFLPIFTHFYSFHPQTFLPCPLDEHETPKSILANLQSTREAGFDLTHLDYEPAYILGKFSLEKLTMRNFILHN